MSYSTIRTEHSVGDVVFVHDPEHDAVLRVEIVGIDARCSKPGYSPEWGIVYHVANRWARQPAAPTQYTEDDIHNNPSAAFPPFPPEPAPELPSAPGVAASTAVPLPEDDPL